MTKMTYIPLALIFAAVTVFEGWVMPQAIGETADWMSTVNTLGVAGVMLWYFVWMQTKSLPAMQAAFREESKEDRLESRAMMERVIAEGKEDRSEGRAMTERIIQNHREHLGEVRSSYIEQMKQDRALVRELIEHLLGAESRASALIRPKEEAARHEIQ